MALINDVLDLSKIEAGKLEIQPVPGDLVHTMQRTRRLFQAQGDEMGLDMMVRSDARLPGCLSYDPVRGGAVRVQPISNAVKMYRRWAC